MKYFKTYLPLIFLLFIFWAQAQELKVHHSSFKITLSDGVNLDNDLYLPDTLQKYPVILLRTPYNKKQYKNLGMFFAQKGFAVLIQDARGKFGSEGKFIPFINEKKDGLETLDWISAQRWCDGNIGGIGTSYNGFSVLTLGETTNPDLKALFTTSAWISPKKMNAPGGAMHLSLAFPWLIHEETQKNRNLREYDLDSLYWTVPLNTALESIGIKSNAMENVSQNYITDDDFPYHKVDIPSFFIVGAFDFVKEATIESYQKTNSVQKKIIFGPWYHNQEHSSRTKVGDEEFGQESFLGNEKILELALKWFEKWLKQEDTGITDQPEAKVFIMFSNRWMEFNEFPPRDITSTFYYLSAENKSNSRLGDGLLNTEKSSKKKFSSYIYDPLNPVPTNGGANFHFFPETVGIKDQREVELREDILVFTSLPITKEIIVIGNVKVQLFAATEGVDTDFTAKLVLVDKNGYAKNICDGIIRARHRDGIEYVKLIEPNKIYEYEIDLGHTAFSVTPGQKLRLEISSSNFPKYNRNFNVEEDPFFATKMKVVQQKIFHNKKYPSKLILPVLNQ